jgi:hypothetical protein
MTEPQQVRPEAVDLLISLFQNYEPGEQVQLRHPDGREPSAEDARILRDVTAAELTAMQRYFGVIEEAAQERIRLSGRLWQMASASTLPDNLWPTFVENGTWYEPGDDYTPSEGTRLHEQHGDMLAANFRARIRPHLSEAEQAEADEIIARLTALPRLT